MSTKNLREVVEAYIKLTGPWDGRSQRTANAQAALAELETIERAAKIMAACGTATGSARWIQTWRAHGR